MPELPEVETIRRQLGAWLVGRTPVGFDVRWPKSLTGRDCQPGSALGRPVTGVWRRGKLLGIDLDGGMTILVHLRMTGQLLVDDRRIHRGSESGPVDPSLPDPSLPDPSPFDTSATRVVVELDDGNRLYFNDQRKFGRMVVVASDGVASDPLLARMGPEPLDDAFDSAALIAALRPMPRRGLKAALLDQSVVAGIGNIYVDEALWHAGLHPERRCGALTRSQKDGLHDAIVTVLSEGVAQGGSTLRDYVAADGTKGRYLDRAAVVGRVGQPCRRCATAIVKVSAAGRGTHLCPNCQRAPRRRRVRPGSTGR